MPHATKLVNCHVDNDSDSDNDNGNDSDNSLTMRKLPLAAFYCLSSMFLFFDRLHSCLWHLLDETEHSLSGAISGLGSGTWASARATC